MASHSQTQGDLVPGSATVPHRVRDINVGPPLAHNNIDKHDPFPFMPPPVSPLQAGEVRRNQLSFSSASVCDLNVPFDMNLTFNQDLDFANDFPFLDYQVSDFPGMGFDVTMGSGCQSPSTMMNSYHAVNHFPNLESGIIPEPISFSSASRSGIENFHRMPLPEERQSNMKQQAEMSRTSTNFRSSALGRPNADIVSGSYDDQVRDNAPQLDYVDGLGGRFLSLGNQNNPAVSTKSTTYQGIPGNMFENPFSPHGQVGNYSYDNSRGRLFQNIHDLGTPLDISGITLAQSNRSDFQAITSSLGVLPVPVLPGEQMNMQHLIPTPRRNMTELRKETGPRISSSDPFENLAQRVPFNSCVLRSNHQNAADPLQQSYVRTNKMLPLPVEISGGIVKQDMSEKISPNVASYAGAGVGFQMSDNSVPQPANHGAAVTVKSQLSQSSTAVTKELTKRNLDSPEQAMMKYQRRKILGQSSSHPFSSHLLQNALGQITAGPPTPLFPTAARSPHYVSAALKGSVINNTTINPTEFPATSRAEGPAYNISSFPYSAMSSPPAFANPSSISAVLPPSAMLNPVPTYAPSTLMHPSISAAPAAFPNTVRRRTGVARIPATHSRKVMSAAFSPSSNSPSPAAAPQKTSSPRTNSNLMSPSVDTLRRSHALAKASPPYATLQSSPTTPHIKWQVSDTPPSHGSKCMLCKRDLSYTPYGPVTVPSMPPPVAVLPCGHTFHDHCLQLITPNDQSKDPPCIPCAVGEN